MAEKTRLKVSWDGMPLGNSRKVFNQSGLTRAESSMSAKLFPTVGCEHWPITRMSTRLRRRVRSMKPTKKTRPLLERMARIERMERGTLSRMGQRPHYNHQTWQDGRNGVRYVPSKQVVFVQEAMDAATPSSWNSPNNMLNEVIGQPRGNERSCFLGKPAPQRPRSRNVPTRTASGNSAPDHY